LPLQRITHRRRPGSVFARWPWHAPVIHRQPFGSSRTARRPYWLGRLLALRLRQEPIPTGFHMAYVLAVQRSLQRPLERGCTAHKKPLEGRPERHSSSSASKRAFLQLQDDRPVQAPLMGFIPLQHIRPPLRCPYQPGHGRSRFGVRSPLRFYASRRGITLRSHRTRITIAFAIALRSTFCVVCLPPQVIAASGRFAPAADRRGAVRRGHSSPVSSRATSQTAHQRTRVALPGRSSGVPAALMGFTPFAALSLRPGQRNVSVRTPHLPFSDSRLDSFSSRNRPRVPLQ